MTIRQGNRVWVLGLTAIIQADAAGIVVIQYYIGGRTRLGYIGGLFQSFCGNINAAKAIQVEILDNRHWLIGSNQHTLILFKVRLPVHQWEGDDGGIDETALITITDNYSTARCIDLGLILEFPGRTTHSDEITRAYIH